MTGGKFRVDVRLRLEHGDQDGLESSEALTGRPRIGYETLEYKGVRAFVELEHVQAINDSDDYNQAGTNPGGAGKTVIADPEGAELNQAYLSGTCPITGIKLKVGRQRMNINNARFLGNVGWRQNEQTFDAATASWSGNDVLDVSYGYIEKVNRIFGEANGTKPAGAKPNAADFNTDSHVVNVSTRALPVGTLTAYAFLLDLGEDNLAATNSSDTVGIRLDTSHELREGCTLKLQAEYAQQEDNSATPNDIDYEAEYYMGDLACVSEDVTIGVGHEVLGSDNGRGFSMPLATLHKFNGWADIFLVTPPAGLEDTYVYASTTLPGSITGKVVYHEFASETGSTDYGSEIDVLLVKKVSENVTVLAKFANYDADNGAGNPRASDVTRASIEAALKF